MTQQEETEEFLAHYGVLGMKWGKTRARASSPDILAARRRTAAEQAKVRSADAKSARIADPQKRQEAKVEVGKMRAAMLNNPDRVIAARMTRGEKAATLALGFVIPGVGLVPAAAAIGGFSARSRRIERKQELGKYNK